MIGIGIWRRVIVGVIVVVVVYVAAVGCSVLVLHGSHGNIVVDSVEPRTDMPIEVMGKGNSIVDTVGVN